jgi:hypothetical protein
MSNIGTFDNARSTESRESSHCDKREERATVRQGNAHATWNGVPGLSSERETKQDLLKGETE